MDGQESREMEKSDELGLDLRSADDLESVRRLASQGDAKAQEQLGMKYKNGDGVSESHETAVKWFREAAEQGYALAQYDLGMMYLNGLGVGQDNAQAEIWLTKAAEQGLAEAQSELGSMCTEGDGVVQSFDEALKWYRKAAQQGEPYAQNNLGVMYHNGEGIDQNYEEALKWYREAAEQGEPYAQNNLGIVYEAGDGVAQSYEEAAKWYRKAAEQGLDLAQFNLGQLYDYGYGVAQDLNEALKWYLLAADQNYGEAQFNLGNVYRWGSGVPQDSEEALKWYRLASDNGVEAAEMAIAQMEANRGLQEYLRDGKPAYYDPIRGMFVLKTPEESVRQQFLHILLNNYQVPTDAIEVEYQLKKHKGASTKRADIIIFNDRKPIMVIECKDPETPLLDDVLQQCKHYADHLASEFLTITNGGVTETYHRLNNDWEPITTFPSFKEMLQPCRIRHRLKPDRTLKPLTYEQVCDLQFLANLNNSDFFCIFGEDTPDNLRPHIAILFNAFFASKNLRSQFPHTYYDLNIAEYLGFKYTSYASASGGQFDGLYAGFRIIERNGNVQIYRIGFFGSIHTENDPKYGSLKGKSQIHVAIDNFDMSPHASIRLSFDKYLKVSKNSFGVNHDGTITVGWLGPAKRDLMLGYVKKHAPYLIGNDGYVHLGEFQRGKLLGFEDVKDFLVRLIKYAQIRDRFRVEYKAAKKRGTPMDL